MNLTMNLTMNLFNWKTPHSLCGSSRSDPPRLSSPFYRTLASQSLCMFSFSISNSHYSTSNFHSFYKELFAFLFVTVTLSSGFSLSLFLDGATPCCPWLVWLSLALELYVERKTQRQIHTYLHAYIHTYILSFFLYLQIYTYTHLFVTPPNIFPRLSLLSTQSMRRLCLRLMAKPTLTVWYGHPFLLCK